MKKCVFSGTFDPPTRGHLQVVQKCVKIFDEVVVAVMINPEKTPFLTTEERVKLLEKLFLNYPQVKVRTFGGAAADLLKEEATPFYVRGIRNSVDFEYENANFFASKKLNGDIIPVYFPAEQENLHISSSAARTCAKFNKDLDEYIPESIAGDLLEILEKKNV